jgi:hypothetical protein
MGRPRVTALRPTGRCLRSRRSWPLANSPLARAISLIDLGSARGSGCFGAQIAGALAGRIRASVDPSPFRLALGLLLTAVTFG